MSSESEPTPPSSTPVPETNLLPAPPADGSDDTTTVEVGGRAISLDRLGPMIVNSDGTLSRISNWAELSERERATTMRVLVKRNQIRLADQSSKQGSEGDELMSAAKST